jgi:hypothetical protein
MESELLTSSNTTIPPEDWALTPPSVRQALLQVLERISALEEELSKLRIENQRLREQTRAIFAQQFAAAIQRYAERATTEETQVERQEARRPTRSQGASAKILSA